MDLFHALNNSGEDFTPNDQRGEARDLVTQLVISVALGLSAFLSFCVLRPRWTGLYAARKRQTDAASSLPDLPDTLFGWIPILYRISEAQILASAGLDAFVFLSFFKMAIKFLTVTLFFSLVVILPVHLHDHQGYGYGGNSTNSSSPDSSSYPVYLWHPESSIDSTYKPSKGAPKPETNFLWMYVVFVYLFTGLAMYLLVSETMKIIRVRQDYLGSQSTITDRTIRLSGIPPEIRSEEKIKDFVERLEIGKVDSVTLCRNWKELDDLMQERMNALRRLEESWTVHLGHRRVERSLESLPTSQPEPPGPAADLEGDNEVSHLLNSDQTDRNRNVPYARERPTTKIRYGMFKIYSRRIDAIDYYEEKLRKLDEKIKATRQKEFTPTALAFVTMDSTATCQMAVQAILDPSPMRLLANLAPAPSDVVWQNTYLSRNSRMFRSWSITLFIVILTIFWSILLIPVAAVLNRDPIRRVFPSLANALDESPIGRSLVQSALPTLVLSLLSVAVPYLYDWLSNLQGMISQGDVQLSVISKNFFFTFFNLFVVFTLFGTASNFYGFVDSFRDAIKDTTKVAYLLASSLAGLSSFYINLIVLQGLGLFPFRLLEFGAVALYPVSLIGAKTPRDYAELVQPPVFVYGFYLPQTLLIFIICTVYSVLPSSWMVLLFGLAYFIIGHFTYKYQLLYAMDHPQHSTGQAWPMIGNRVILGLLVFQLAMFGELALKGAIKRSIIILPLLLGTVWFSYFFRRTYEPLTRFIALGSIHKQARLDYNLEGADGIEQRDENDTDGGQTIDEERESGLKFVNPALSLPLEEVWVVGRKEAQNAEARPHEGGVTDGENNV
ncbi:MAG: hypothetical protein M1827_003030 [Pycnora praestabilis]|nr:MAG: hypothetical protein M1827_003030 [Pycnora praestabilis]